ncbi:hypothetical protein Ttaiw_00608 [Tepidimonas taiwanensis]|uniref:Chemotaxis protein CheZ n=1 Tax=Tepidimonas taiwanensis TaxID=307486 RepID=A0A554XBZ8_9BURK|nr:hypothetical protein Ttaiw_00608 [Tepidimonas taiwanensis]
MVEPRPDPKAVEDEPAVSIRVAAVADLQDSLLVAMNDLKRLEGLLDHATVNLLDRFNRAIALVDALSARGEDATVNELRQTLNQAVLELQFHDMATQLLVHTGKVLRGCAYLLAEQAMEPDEEEVGSVVTYLPQKPNPVTQSEMDAGSIELF